MSQKKNEDSWSLEIALSLLIGLPWYYFSKSMLLAAAVHGGLILLFLFMEFVLFGRGGVIESFLFVFILSVLVGLIATGFNAGRLGF